MSFVLAFAYRVAGGGEAEFERVYGPRGEWAALFARADGYLGTELHRSVETPGAYLVLDRWSDAAAHRAFLAEHGAEYERRAAGTAALYDGEERLGAFEAVA